MPAWQIQGPARGTAKSWRDLYPELRAQVERITAPLRPRHRLGRHRDLGLARPAGAHRSAAGRQRGALPRARGLCLPPWRTAPDLAPGGRAGASCGRTAAARARPAQGRPAGPADTRLPGVRDRLPGRGIAGRDRRAGEPGSDRRGPGRADRQGQGPAAGGVARAMGRQAGGGARPPAQRADRVHDRRRRPRPGRCPSHDLNRDGDEDPGARGHRRMGRLRDLLHLGHHRRTQGHDGHAHQCAGLRANIVVAATGPGRSTTSTSACRRCTTTPRSTPTSCPRC